MACAAILSLRCHGQQPPPTATTAELPILHRLPRQHRFPPLSRDLAPAGKAASGAARAAARIASRELARDVRAAAREPGLEALISDDCLAVETAMAEAAPELVLGTRMERHSAKRLGVPCAVISAPPCT